MNERTAYIALNMMEKVGPVKVRALAEALGSAEAVFDASEDTLRQVKGIGPGLAASISTQRRTLQPEAEEERAGGIGARLVTFVDDDYPEALKAIHDPPLALYVRGTLEPSDKRAMAVIGSRRTSHYGRQTADILSYQLCKCGFTVVSGLARGIDAAAHEGALKGKGRTLAVIGSALDCLYPPEHKDLAERIVAQGALISEFPLGTQPGRTTFPMRNRIVSGLSMGILVVEAAKNSGAMITASEGAEQGRLIFAVPNRIDAPGASGCHYLIKNGAKLVESVDDIVAEFEYLHPAQPELALGDSAATISVPLDKAEQKMMDAILHEPLGIDDLCRKTGLPIHQINALLIGLEMKKLIRMLPGRQIERVSATPFKMGG